MVFIMAKKEWKVENYSAWNDIKGCQIVIDEDTIVLHDKRGRVARVYRNTGLGSKIKSAQWRDYPNSMIIYIQYENGYTEAYTEWDAKSLFRNDTGDILSKEFAQPEDYALQEAFYKRTGRNQTNQIDEKRKKRKEEIEDNEGGGIKSTFQKIKKWFKIIFWTIVIIIALCYILPEIL